MQLTADAAFAKGLEFVLRWEGGYVDHPKDPGGPTNRGITLPVLRQRSWGDLDHDGDIDKDDIRLVSPNHAAEIYRTDFWNRIYGDQLPPVLAIATFDAGVNCGLLRARTWLQMSVGAHPDGAIGPITLRAARSLNDQRGAFYRCITYRDAHYRSLRTFPTFGKGWLRRLADLREFVQPLLRG